MKKIAVVFCVVFSFAAAGVAQTARRSVTNADLTKFEARRVDAERQYRETYASKGMLSPEEVTALNEKRVKETIDLAARLNAAELERERLALESNAQLLEIQQMQMSQGSTGYYPVGSSILGSGYFIDSSGRRFRGRGFPIVRSQSYYAAGGSVWPAPLGTTLQRAQRSFRVSRPIGGRGRRH
jgi:hypothetical protein